MGFYDTSMLEYWEQYRQRHKLMYFTSVLKLVESEVHAAKNSAVPMQVDTGQSKISLHLPSDQPRPPNSSSKPVSLSFDKILPPSITGSALYKQTAKEVVESALLGYHGTVITFSSASTKKEQSDFTWSPSNGMVLKATKQIIRCLKKSKSSTSNLVILCSFVMVADEEVRDLLHRFSRGKQGGRDQTNLPPKLASRELSGASQHVITSGADVSAMLRYGRGMQRAALDSSVMPDATPTQQRHHTLFTLTVEFSQFGSMNAAVSGNLQFADLAAADPLAIRQRFTTGAKVDKAMLSLFTFADVVESLSSNVAVLDTIHTSHSAFNQELETAFLPHVPTAADSSNLHEKSVLTRLLRESLGGNCKTLLMTYAPTDPPMPLNSGVLESLKLASRARIIQNTPNKRDLAEKALMSAYLRGLEEMYGQPVGGSKGEQKSELTGNMESGLGDARGEDDESQDGDVAGQRDSLRQRNMEMAATALVAAALEGGDEDSGSEEENEGSFVWGDGEVTRRKSKAKALAPEDRSTDRGAGVLIQLNEEQNVTLQTLVAILQDPDEGVSRPSLEALSNVKIKKDAGALFSGSAIVQWLKANISGVRSERDAEMIGQMLLDSEHIFHSEGSRVFADAETLFYHVRYARMNRKSISLDEVQALLKAAGSPGQGVDPQSDPQSDPPSVDAASSRTGGDKTALSGEEMELKDVEDVDFGEGAVSAAVKGDCPAVKVDCPNMLSQVDQASLPHDKSALKHDGELELQDVDDDDLDRDAAELDGRAAAVKTEEWMADDSGEEDNDLEEETVTGPNTAPLRKLPTLHILESSVNYPHPLHMAVAIGKAPAVVRELVMMFGVNQQDSSQRTPLMFAALGNNKSSSCNTLLRCAAEVDLQDRSGLTALHVACYHGNKSAASALLSNKASIATRDKLGHSALHWSMVPHDPGCLQLLARHSMHPNLLNHADTNGLTAMHWSIFYSHSQHLDHLLRRCNRAGQIDLRALDSEGRTLALYAIEKNSASCLKVLLDADPSLLTLPGRQGSTPLHHAAIQDTADCLCVLLDFRPPKNSPVSGLDVQTDQSLWTCLHYAVAYFRLESVAALISRGARVDIKDSDGKTAVDHASSLEEGKEEMLAALRGVNSSEVPMSDVKESGAGVKESMKEKDEPFTEQRSKCCSLS